MHPIPSTFRRFLIAILVSASILSGCGPGAEDKTVRTGDEGSPCKVLAGLPPAPDGAQELTDPASLDMVDKFTGVFKTNAKVETVIGKAYLTRAPFGEVDGFYEAELKPGWEYRDNIVKQISKETASVAAWSSCTDELVAIFFFEDVNLDRNGLIVLYAKP